VAIAKSVNTKLFGLAIELGGVCAEHLLVELAASWAFETAGQPAIRAPISPDLLVERLLAACRPDRPGRLDAVLVVLAQKLLPKQIVAMNVADLGQVPGQTCEPPEPEPVYIVLGDPRGLVQRATPVIEFRGRDAGILRAWHAERVGELAGDDAPFAAAATLGRQCVNAVTKRITKLASTAGLTAPGGPGITARTLFKSRQNADHRDHPVFQTARLMDLDPAWVLREFEKHRT